MNQSLFPGFVNMRLEIESRNLIFYFYDNSRVVISLRSGNPLLMESFSLKKSGKHYLAARFIKEVSKVEYWNEQVCVSFKDKRTIEIPFSDIPRDKTLPATIINRIRRSAENYPGKNCEIFVGSLFPTHTPLTIRKQSFKTYSEPLEGGPLNESNMDLEIINNIFVAAVWSDAMTDELPTRLVGIQGQVQAYLDVLGFGSGLFYEASVSEIFNLENHVILEHPKVEADEEMVQIWMERYAFHLKTFESDKPWYLTFALNDFKMAMHHPMNTGFYCRRAFESLSRHCANILSIKQKDDVKRWDTLLEIIEMDREIFLEIKDYSGKERHGNSQGITSEVRNRFIVETRAGMIKYFEWVASKLIKDNHEAI